MARTSIAINELQSFGRGLSGALSTTAADATNDMVWSVNQGRDFLWIRNPSGSGATCNVTVGATSVAVEQDEDWIFGPFDPLTYNEDDNTVNVDLDFDTTVIIAVIRLPARYSRG